MPFKALPHAAALLSKTNSADGFVKNQVARFESQQKLLLGPELHKLPFKIKPELKQRMTPFNAISQASSAGEESSLMSSTGRTRRSVLAKAERSTSADGPPPLDNLESCLEYTSSCLPSCYWQSYTDSKLPTSSPAAEDLASADPILLPHHPDASADAHLPDPDLPAVLPTRSLRGCSSVPISPMSGKSLVLLTNQGSAEAPSFGGAYTPEFTSSADDDDDSSNLLTTHTVNENQAREFRRLFQRTEQLKKTLLDNNRSLELESVPSRPIPGVISRIVAEAKLTCEDEEDDEGVFGARRRSSELTRRRSSELTRRRSSELTRRRFSELSNSGLYADENSHCSVVAPGDDESDEDGASRADWHKCESYDPVVLLPPPQISVVIVTAQSRRDSGAWAATSSSVISSCEVDEHTPPADEHTPKYSSLLKSVFPCCSNFVHVSPKCGRPESALD